MNGCMLLKSLNSHKQNYTIRFIANAVLKFDGNPISRALYICYNSSLFFDLHKKSKGSTKYLALNHMSWR
ncbi:hypothetical protein TNCT_460011 [Trichonephila clavata]|uniref:Uncharacterized protein n=1 Tax=Trichonephila clavata TaxID=2740835 RepID=A0A8X6HIC8_TRICU|nr:hypothetical protein TNCT_460011 [Trichonephila clavata]